MRNIFDQYSHPENRLTHALAACLDEDRALLRDWLGWLGVAPPARPKKLNIVEQSLPGEAAPSEDEAERRGLPDFIVHDGDTWCIAVESKIMATLTVDQLRRHRRTLARRGFESITILALTKSIERRGSDVMYETWSRLYEWLGHRGRRREWSSRLRDYLRVAELRLSREEYLTEGSLTIFDGFPFSDDHPYSYGEAKRLLKLALSQLRSDARLKRLGVEPSAQGRSAITGKGGLVVWDFLSLRGRSKGANFTEHPHLTLGVHADRLEVAVTIPNGVSTGVRRALGELGVAGLVEINSRILKRARRLIGRGAVVRALAVQRHYISQRSRGIIDAELSFKLETSQTKRTGRVRTQREWIELFASLPHQKRSNIQFQYRVDLPWSMKGLDTRKSLDIIVESWFALAPLVAALNAELPSKRTAT